jgi:hypothetical protein
MTNTKFCTSCQATRQLEGGERRVTRGVPRWICQACIERKSESIYKSQRADAIEARKKNEQR